MDIQIFLYIKFLFQESSEPNPEPEVTMWEPEGEPDEYEDENEPPHTPVSYIL